MGLREQLRRFPPALRVWRKVRWGCISTGAYRRRIEGFFSNSEKSLAAFRVKPQAGNLILSFTSFAPRIQFAEYTLFSVLNQTMRPARVILWLSEKDFPGKEQDIPDSLKRYGSFDFEIRFVKENFKSYKKLHYALGEFPDHVIVTFDDDVYYKPRWLEKLYRSHLKDPAHIAAHRVHTVSFAGGHIDRYKNWKRRGAELSFLNFFTGAGGVLYPPRSLYTDANNHRLFLALCPAADDIWFYVMALLQHTKIRRVKNGYRRALDFDYIFSGEYRDIPRLADANVEQDRNDFQLKGVLEHYDLYDSFYELYGDASQNQNPQKKTIVKPGVDVPD
jgi:hypothetical protein